MLVPRPRDGAVLVRVAAGMGLAAVALTDGPAQCTLKDDLAGKPFAMKDDLLDAMALVNPPVATLADLRAYDGCNLATCFTTNLSSTFTNSRRY